MCAVGGARGESRKEKRSFATFTHDLLRLADWLRECGVTHVAMESTGVYWKPVWNISANATVGTVSSVKKQSGLNRSNCLVLMLFHS